MISQVKCVTSTDDIILHSKNLKIDEGNTVLRTLNETQDTPTISKISQDTENDFLILQLSKSLNVDFHYEVELRFEGDLEEDKVGYCKNPYFDEVGNENWIAVTYFKPNNARRAFPCFDEPNFKANFTVILGRSIKFKSVSNMPLLKTQEM